jgi:uncharacterized protein involved in outer membrane biogenesis
MPRASDIREKLLRKRVVISFLVLLFVFLAAKFGASIWLNTQRAQLEQFLTTASGYNVQIKGAITATLLPTPGAALHDVELSRDGRNLATVQQFQARFYLASLLRRQLSIRSLDLYGAKLRLAADAKGVPQIPLGPVAKPGADGNGATKPKPGVRLPHKVELRNSSIDVADSAGQVLYSIHQFNMALYPMQSGTRATKSGGRKDPDFTAYLNFQQAKLRGLEIGPTDARFRLRSGKLVMEVSRARVLGGIAKAVATWDDSGATPSVHAKFSLHHFDASESSALFGRKPFAQGHLNLDGDLTALGSGPASWPGTLNGNVALTGADLELTTTDLDALIAQTIKSQQYNLVDAAAYFFIGPLGATATKGMDIANVFLEFGKSGTTRNRILRLNSNWTIADGVARASDVALETPKYLLAMKGGVNLPTRQFQKLRIAVVNEHGCAIAAQTIDGPIASPRIEKLNILLTLTRPVIDALAKTAKALLTAGKCDPFYTGVLLPDQPKKQPRDESPAAEDEGGQDAQIPTAASGTGKKN